MDENKNIKSENEQTLEEIVKHECGCRTCKCGKDGCEFAADFFDDNGNPTPVFGTDADLLNKQGQEAAVDFDDYAERVGITENGESIYHNTAEYRMIDPSGDSADTSKS